MCVMVLLLPIASVPPVFSKSLATGDIVGVVTDPSGAVIPHANVTLENVETNSTRTQTTNAAGAYRFSLLPPGRYTLSVEASAFRATTRAVVARVAQTITVNMQVALAARKQVITVTAEGLVQPNNVGLSTTLSNDQIALVPNGGGDLSYIGQTTPGALMNTLGGFGNFSTFGLPSTSNYFSYNGMSEMDPILTINATGATNILLGLNDIQEATVVNNGYSGQYGGLAGAQVSWVSKSGTNNFHGNAIYWWNGRPLNANNVFNKQSTPPTPRPFVNANQWAASLGGPIKKDKTFFFVDTEGLRLAIPIVSKVNVPSLQFEQATLANISAAKRPELPFYKNIFELYKGAPGTNRAANVLKNGGCSDFTGTKGFGIPGGPPCALQFNSTINGLSNEWLLTARLDQNIGNGDRLFIHFRTDQGLQATWTDFINPLFNITSPQPQYEGQLNETHKFGNRTVNSLTLSGSYYRAIFVQPDRTKTLSLLPEQVSFVGDAFQTVGFGYQTPFPTPQGRNGSQYQVVDDITHARGRHNVSAGVNFVRNNTTVFDTAKGSAPAAVSETLTDFFNGFASVLQQNFPTRLSQPLATYSLGLYAQDEWQARKNLTLMLALRVDRYSNPTCRTDCFARLRRPFAEVSHDPNQPYNQTIETGLAQAFPNLDETAAQPRVGFSWTPSTSRNMVVRGGFGLFSDYSGTALLATSMMNNFPNSPQFIVSGPFAIDPNAPRSAASVASTGNQVFQSQFSAGGTLNSITNAIAAAGGSFFGPSFTNVARKLQFPSFQEWSLGVQQGLGQKMTLSVTYVGNHGIHEGLANAALNAYCDASCLGSKGLNTSASSFQGLPRVVPDPRFGTVTELHRSGVSNYNGVTISLSRRLSSLQFQANYSWSHALDTLSNNGIVDAPFNFNTNLSIGYPQQNISRRQAIYGNADYDVRQNFSLNYVWKGPEKLGWRSLLGGWVISGTVFAHTGTPFTVIDTGTTGVLAGFNYGATVFANQLKGGVFHCGQSAANPNSPCQAMVNNFASPVTPTTASFGNQRRNQVFGPHYFDTDFAIMKNFKLPRLEALRFAVGAQFYNILNHPNFDQPVQDVANSNFGLITRASSPPSSIYGAFLGGDASPRVIQLKALVTF